MSDEAEVKEDGWICPIEKKCSPRKMHRLCQKCLNSSGGEAKHCWDCCKGCCEQDCIHDEPPKDSVDYDLPPGESF